MRTRPDPLPLAAGAFLREVRSVTVLYEPLPDGSLPDAGRIAAWLQAYDTAFKIALGVPRGHGLHLLYGRSLNILGPRLLDQLPAVLTLAETAHACGFSVGLQLKIGEILEMPQELAALMDDRPMGSVFLDFRDVPDSGVLDSAALALVETFMDAGVSLTLLASPEVLRRAGVFDSVVVNAANVQIIPSADGAVEPVPLPQRPAGRPRKTIPIGAPLDRQRPGYDPCATRMQLFIGADGGVYPCQGLAGLGQLALCHVNDPFDPACVAPGGPWDWAGWLSWGPGLAPALDGASTVCERHRQQLETVVTS